MHLQGLLLVNMHGGCFVHVERISTWHGNLFELMQKRIRRAAAFNLGSTQQL